MDKATYEKIKRTRKIKDDLRAKRRYGRNGHLARKIAARRKYFASKRRAVSRRFEAALRTRFEKGKRKMDMKAVKFSVKATKWGSNWDRRAARWEARARKLKSME